MSHGEEPQVSSNMETEVAKSPDRRQESPQREGGDTETVTEDPFRVRLKFSYSDYLSMTAVFITLVPLRVIVALISLILAWGVSMVGLYDCDLSVPVSGWRKSLQQISCFFGRLCCRCCGFTVRITGSRVSKSVAPVLVAAPHSSFFDALAIFWSGLPFIVSREENRDLLFIGKCVQFAQGIFVSRDSKESREECKMEITRRVNSPLDWPQFLIFPEGTTSNRKALMAFKPGGFLAGAPVQPVLIRYHLPHDTVSWTWDQPHGFVACFLFTICQVWNEVELQYLEPHLPTEEEKQDPLLFANNVRREMASALGVPVCDMTFEDIKQKYSRKKDN